MKVYYFCMGSLATSLLGWAVQLVVAQTLTPAEPPTDWHGYGVWLLIALGVVGIVLFLKHNPTTVASLRARFENLATAHADLSTAHATLVEKHADLVDAHAELAAKVPAPTPSTETSTIRSLV